MVEGYSDINQKITNEASNKIIDLYKDHKWMIKIMR